MPAVAVQLELEVRPMPKSKALPARTAQWPRVERERPRDAKAPLQVARCEL
jgi:hypothetical protein